MLVELPNIIVAIGVDESAIARHLVVENLSFINRVDFEFGKEQPSFRKRIIFSSSRRGENTRDIDSVLDSFLENWKSETRENLV